MRYFATATVTAIVTATILIYNGDAKLPRHWPGTPKPPRRLAVAALHVFGHVRYARALCIAWYENRYTTVVSPTDDHGFWQVNRPSHPWVNFHRLDNPRETIYNARVAYRISRGGRDWTPWAVYNAGYCR